MNKIFKHQYWPAWIAVTLFLAIVVASVLPPTQALAYEFLSLFRVQRIEIIEFSSEDTSELDAFGGAQGLEILLKEAHLEMDGESQVVAGTDEASSLAGFPVRLPRGQVDRYSLVFHPRTRMTLLLDLEAARHLLSATGQYDVDLPESLDSAEVTIEFPSSVIAISDVCSLDQDSWQVNIPSSEMKGCTTLLQMQSPSISIPPELDADQFGTLYLQVMGMSYAEAVSLSDRIDWTTTLVVPVAHSDASSFLEVTVDGARGTLVRQIDREGYILIWVKQDIVYAFLGNGDAAEALEIADSLQ